MLLLIEPMGQVLIALILKFDIVFVCFFPHGFLTVMSS